MFAFKATQKREDFHFHAFSQSFSLPGFNSDAVAFKIDRSDVALSDVPRIFVQEKNLEKMYNFFSLTTIVIEERASRFCVRP